MVLSIGKLGQGQERYYLEAIAEGAEDYYVYAGEAPGRWGGGGSESLELHGEVAGADFTAGGRRSPDGRMPLREHLRELRRRVGRAALGLLVGSVAGWLAYPQLFDALQRPILEVAGEGGRLVALNFGGVATPLDLQIKVALFAGSIVSSPWWIYQLWAFVTPGLTRRERWYTLGVVAAAVPLFLAGAGVAWWLLPKAVELLAGFTPRSAANLIDAQTYLGFIMRMVLAFGLAFLLPVLMVGLNLVGFVRGRTWLAGWRWAVLLGFVFAAIVTPTADAISMFALAVPICLLYFGAVGICVLVDRRRDRRAGTDHDADLDLAPDVEDGPEDDLPDGGAR